MLSVWTESVCTTRFSLLTSAAEGLDLRTGLYSNRMMSQRTQYMSVIFYWGKYVQREALGFSSLDGRRTQSPFKSEESIANSGCERTCGENLLPDRLCVQQSSGLRVRRLALGSAIRHRYEARSTGAWRGDSEIQSQLWSERREIFRAGVPCRHSLWRSSTRRQENRVPPYVTLGSE